jgi:hypothetical protein
MRRKTGRGEWTEVKGMQGRVDKMKLTSPVRDDLEHWGGAVPVFASV